MKTVDRSCCKTTKLKRPNDIGHTLHSTSALLTFSPLQEMNCQVENGCEAKSAPSAAELLSPENVRNLFDSVDAFLFDCDGVIWKGDKLIDGVPETLEMLRSKGKKLVFVTNNSRKSRKQYAKKFLSLGIAVHEDEIFSSSFAAAMYLKVNDFPPEKKVYVIGEEGILEELNLAGFMARKMEKRQWSSKQINCSSMMRYRISHQGL